MPHHTENVKTGAVNWQCHREKSRLLRTMARKGRTRQRVAGGLWGGGADRAAADLKKLTRKPDHLRTGRSVTSRERGKNGLVYLGPVVECK